MINWVLYPKWQSFQLNILKSNVIGLGFGIVSETGVTATEMQALTDLYCKFQLAHVCHNPVIIFGIEDLSVAGAPLFNAEPNTPVVYHIPQQSYPELENAISDDPFIISDKAIAVVEGTQGLMGSIYTSLDKLHDEQGLIVCGMYTGETDVQATE